MTEAIRAAAAGIQRELAQRCQAADPAAAAQAELAAAAAATGLLAAVLAVDEQQLQTIQRLLADLAAPERAAQPARVLLTLALVLSRHVAGEQAEAGQVAAGLFTAADEAAALASGEARPAAWLLGTARLWLLAASWLDGEGTQAAAIGRGEAALASGLSATDGCAVAARLLAAVCGAKPESGPEAWPSPLAEATAALLAAAVAVAADEFSK